MENVRQSEVAVADYERMRDIERRYQAASGLKERRYYSLFYGPLAPFPLAMINENPGGSPDDFKIVDVYAGSHEYVEGRFSGPTTLNASTLLMRLLGGDSHEIVRPVQVFNQHFRRSPGRLGARERRRHVDEARPFVLECLAFARPKLLLFGGANGVQPFMTALGGTAVADDATTVMGPNGTSPAVYYREYRLHHPLLGPMSGIGLYHPSKLNGHFYAHAFPRLLRRVNEALAGTGQGPRL
ncbi:hypothetical protein STHU_09440 [Allostella humosa]|nr:hypothetical protein STHU_09440 [Stella humosa]